MFLEFIITNIVPVLIGGVVVILVGVVAIFWIRSRKPKAAPLPGTDFGLGASGNQAGKSGREAAKARRRADFGLQLVLDDDQVFHLDLPTTIGRSQESSIVITDESVSIQHARIYFDRRLGAVCIRDLDSTNGIFIDGRPTRENVLEDGARLTIGSISLTFRDTGYLPPA